MLKNSKKKCFSLLSLKSAALPIISRFQTICQKKGKKEYKGIKDISMFKLDSLDVSIRLIGH